LHNWLVNLVRASLDQEESVVLVEPVAKEALGELEELVVQEVPEVMAVQGEQAGLEDGEEMEEMEEVEETEDQAAKVDGEAADQMVLDNLGAREALALALAPPALAVPLDHLDHLDHLVAAVALALAAPSLHPLRFTPTMLFRHKTRLV
jgi:hypothetical protein